MNFLGLRNESDLERENATILADIVDICESSEGTSTKVILLLGKSNAGKSAAINTNQYALTGKYYNIVTHGSGRARFVTQEL